MLNRQEPWRPQFHFSAQRNWINDPNGLVWFEGEYHLFFQYNPFGDQWGHMSWGHAVSTDLVHWQELPVAIAETDHASIFSGSVVVDWHNTSGLAPPKSTVPPLVAVYTACRREPAVGQAQSIAYSLDRGRTWTHYPGNPVLDLGLRDFRDPKVFWHAPTHHWVMAVVLPDQHQVAFYRSADLKHWDLQSHFYPGDAEADSMGIWECPDLIELPLAPEHADASGPTLWVLKVDAFEGHPSKGSGARLYYGQFDGASFTPNPACPPTWADQGADFYAALSFANLPDGRSLWLAWMNCHRYAKHLPTQPWRGAMTVPRELSLRQNAVTQAWQLVQRPARELQALRASGWQRDSVQVVDSELTLLPDRLSGHCLELRLELTHVTAAVVGLDLHYDHAALLRIAYDANQQSLWVDRSRSGYIPPDPHYAEPRGCRVTAPNPHQPLRLHVFVDWSSIELFANDGEWCWTEQIHPPQYAPSTQPNAVHGGPIKVTVFAHGGALQLRNLSAWPLRPAHWSG